jgi:hypothetical protein
MWYKRTNLFLLLSCLAVALCALPAGTRAADRIGSDFEKPTILRGQVVDLLCTLQGGKNCPPNCGGGTRQFGVLTENNELRAVFKGPALFAGAQVDLLAYCGKTITMDGLMIENPKMTAFQVQGIKADPAQKDFAPAEAFEADWTAKNGKSDEWFRNDPRIKAIIAKDGPLGNPDWKVKR